MAVFDQTVEIKPVKFFVGLKCIVTGKVTSVTGVKFIHQLFENSVSIKIYPCQSFVLYILYLIVNIIIGKYVLKTISDDLDVAEDFFSYMAALRPLLDKDPTVWCISAWNDNGEKALVDTSANSEKNL